MAWKVASMERTKQSFILLFQTGKFTMTELCTQFGINRPTGYKILEHYEHEGWDALDERSQAHYRHSFQTSQTIEDALLAERKRHPRWGARKLLVLV